MLKSATTAYSSCHPQTLRSGVTGFLRPSKHTHTCTQTPMHIRLCTLFLIFVEVVLIFLEGMGETRPSFFLFLFVSVHDGGKDSRDIRGGGGNRKGGRKKETASAQRV